MQTNAAQDHPIRMDFLQPVAMHSQPGVHAHRRRCRSCGCGASRRAIYCSGCGHRLNQLVNRNTLRQAMIVLSAIAACALFAMLFIYLCTG